MLSAAQRIGLSCVAARARLISRVVTKTYDDALRPLGLRVNQLDMLVCIDLMPGMTASQLSALLVMEKSTVSRNLRRLREAGWVATQRRALQLTEAGRGIIGAAEEHWQSAQNQVSQLISDDQKGSIFTVADGLRRGPLGRANTAPTSC